MDRYLSAKKPTTPPVPHSTCTKIYEDRQRRSEFLAPLSADGKKPSSSTIKKHLLSTLSDKSNPITHSNIYERSGKSSRSCGEATSLRSDTVVSAATGHQRGEGRTPHGTSAKVSFEDRSRTLSVQRRDRPTEGVLSNVRVYIDGYLSGTTSIEVRRIIAGAGGSMLSVPIGATHIVTSRQLSGSKTHRILTAKSGNSVYIVKPEWVFDSILAGRRLQESHYALTKPSSTRSLVDMFKSGGPNCSFSM